MFPKGILTGANIYIAPLLEEYHNADIKNDIINRIVEGNLSNYIDTVNISNVEITDADILNQINKKNINNENLISMRVTISLVRLQLLKKNVKLADIIEKIEDYNAGILVAEKKNTDYTKVAHKSIIILFFTNAAAQTLFAEVTNDMIKVSITNLTDSIIVNNNRKS